MSNFFKCGSDDKILGGNADWEAQAKTLEVNFITHKCISQYFEQKFENFSE